MSNCLWPHELQYARLPCPSLSPGVCSNSRPLSRCHPTISSSVTPFSSCLQSFPAPGSFPMSQVFASGGQSTEASASASVFSINIQDWFPLELTGWISLQSKGLSRVFSSTIIRKHQITLQYYIVNCVSWVPRLTLLGLWINWTYKHVLGWNSFICGILTV